MAGLSSKKLDAIVQVLKEDFLDRRSTATMGTSRDYIVKVLLPESIIKLAMD